MYCIIYIIKKTILISLANFTNMLNKIIVMLEYCFAIADIISNKFTLFFM